MKFDCASDFKRRLHKLVNGSLKTVIMIGACLQSTVLSKKIIVCSAVTSTEIFYPGNNQTSIVSSYQPITLVRPSSVFFNPFVLLFGGQVFGTGSPNLNALKFNLKTNQWSVLETALPNSFGLVSSNVMLDYFHQSGNLIFEVVSVIRQQ